MDVNEADWRVANAAGFPDLRLFLYLGLMARSEAYDFAEELLVDLAIGVRHRLTANG